MIPYLLLGASLFVAAVSLLILWRAIGLKTVGSWHGVLLSISLAAFVYLYGAWLFLSVWLKYVFAGLFLVLFAIRLVRKRSVEIKAASAARVTANLLLSAIFISLSVLYFTGTTGKPYGIAQLQLPFKNGQYIIFQGGYGLPTNVFHYGLRGAVYAIDLAKLNKFGNRANAIFSTRLQDYEIFNDTVYSPCAGVIAHTTDINPDNIPPERKRGPSNTNHVLIATDSFYVFMGHLGYHKVFVKEGDKVLAGQPVGLAGNSGFSLEPHLHIQVHARTNSHLPWFKEKPLLIEFGGKRYLLFDVIDAK